MSYCSVIRDGVAFAYHTVEAARPGLGRGIAWVVGGASAATAGVAAMAFRTAVCYAADRGLTCGSIINIPVAAAVALTAAGVGGVIVGRNLIKGGATGDRTVSAGIAAQSLGRLTGNAELGDSAQKLIQAGSDGIQAGSELISIATDLKEDLQAGYARVSSYWTTPAAAATPSEVKKTD